MGYKAFVSSTFEDLKDHRRGVIDSLRDGGIHVDPMENWTAAKDEPKVFCQERLDGCDFCVLLVGFRVGYVPKGERMSTTQLEYFAAVERGMTSTAEAAGPPFEWCPDRQARKLLHDE